MENKKSFFDSLQNTLGKLSMKLNGNIYIDSIKEGMLAYMAFAFIASIFLIISYFPVPQFADFVSMITGLEKSVWQAKLNLVNDSSLAIGGLLVLVAVSRSLADKMGINGMQVMMTSMVSYLLLTPYAQSETGNVIKVASIGAQSIFIALVISILTAKIYKFIDSKGIKIKMPATVPTAVSAPFESIIPSLFVITFFWIIRLLIDGIFQSSALDLFNATLGAPLKMVGGSLFGVVVVKVFSQLLWFFGIHGDSIVSGVMNPIFQVLQDENKAAYIAGNVPTNIICQSFWDSFASVGVVGSIVAIIIIAKSKRYKEMKKIAGAPYIFNIGEPTLFGIPLMMNITYFIPFILSNVVSILISYSAFALKLVPIPTGLVQMPWTTPIVISGYLVTGSIAGSILQIVCLVAVVLFWLPFVKVADNQLLKEEAGICDESTQIAKSKEV